jgi:hypothetical protein
MKLHWSYGDTGGFERERGGGFVNEDTNYDFESPVVENFAENAEINAKKSQKDLVLLLAGFLLYRFM